MIRTRNQALADWMTEHSMTAAALADQVNGQLATLTGRPGTTSDRTIRRWLSGEVRWPQANQREALVQLTGLPSRTLGFVPRHSRRQLPAASGPEPARGGIPLSPARDAAPASFRGPLHRVGSGDVARLAAKLTDIVDGDHRHGGTASVENDAAVLLQQALDLQQRGTTSTRVRNSLYSLAAAFAGSALWAATEGQRFTAAQQHLHQAVILAGLSADSSTQYFVWNVASSLYRQLGLYTDALAASDVSRSLSVNRSDPLFASLTFMQNAVHHGCTRDDSAALRSIGHAEDALGRADPALSRPPWIRFYDQAGLDLFAVISLVSLERWPDAEARAHRTLAVLSHRPDLARNRHRAVIHLARAQLEQGALESATTSIGTIPSEAWHGRTGRLVTAFTTRMGTLAPDAPETRTWTACVRHHSAAAGRMRGE
ncbi:Tat pathway signal protein [Streptomyces aureoverticillatus]|uniref:Tat pathway signal protein n=1 Tax=Streptomyces aureoverticillatus TaxID=66871 RepID=UPI0013DBD753|nr:Tat pathway signal protein [Streptomyces aureoverticillatus]QIB42676.1 Tat pathway signal protein [Streptomyces aureoverticillatus]